MSQPEWVSINLGLGVSREDVINITREVRGLFIDELHPNGDRKKKAQLKVTRDRYGQYHIYLNQQALLFIMLFASKLRDTAVKQAATDECPPDVPDFLRWDKPSGPVGSKPE